MLAWPRLLAARSLFGLLTPPKAPPLDEGCCWRLACCGAGRAAGCALFCAGLDALVFPVAGFEALVFPVEGLAVGVLAGAGRATLFVVGRVPPVWPKPRSPEGFLAGGLPVATRLFAPRSHWRLCCPDMWSGPSNYCWDYFRRRDVAHYSDYFRDSRWEGDFEYFRWPAGYWHWRLRCWQDDLPDFPDRYSGP